MKAPAPDAKPPRDVRTVEPEELVYADDRVIGRAFRWSFAVLAILVVSGLGLWQALKPKSAPASSKMTTLLPPARSGSSAPVPVPPAKFTDITRAAGVDFVHVNGAYGDRLLPEATGSGVAFADFDNDGNPDLLCVNSRYWPGDTRHSGTAQPTMALYRNDGAGHFDNVTAGSGLDVSFYGMGVAAGDYDNDGLPDVFITGVGGGRLFHNQGAGKFQDVTATAGVGGEPDDWSTAAVWFDYDNDGRLDLFVANYVQWSKAIDLEVGSKPVRPTRNPPNCFGTAARPPGPRSAWCHPLEPPVICSNRLSDAVSPWRTSTATATWIWC